jgi:hypothetical protein
MNKLENIYEKETETILFAFLEVSKAEFAIEAMPGTADASYACSCKTIYALLICMIDSMQSRITGIHLATEQCKKR